MSKTKLSKETLAILKNYSQINSNLLVKEGNVINTISPAKNIVSESVVTENFEVEFGIWDLSKLLGTISLFEDPEFEFGEKSMIISGRGGGKVSYYYSEPRLLTTLTREVKMPEPVISFKLTESVFESVQRSASVLQLPDLCIKSSDEGTIELVALDKKTPTTNSYTVEVGTNPKPGSTFSFYLKNENLKLLSGDYTVDVCSQTVTRFTHTEHDTKYYIAQESDSSYHD